MTVNTNEPKQTTLYYREGSSDKVYQVSLEANGSPEHFLVRFAFGRRGSTLQTGTKTAVPVDYDTALRTFNQLVASKMAKGYTPGESGTPYEHSVHEGRATGIYPQLLEAVADSQALGHLLIDPLYCAQEKFDGKRLLIRKRGTVVEGINRQGLVVSIPGTIARDAANLPGNCVIDGEAVGDILHVFDVLEHNSVNYRATPYDYRLDILRELIPSTCPALLPAYTAKVARDKTNLYTRLRQQNKEGIVLKLLAAEYTPGKTSSAALKYKFVESASFVVNLINANRRSVSLGLFESPFSMTGAGCVTIPPNHPVPEVGTVVEVTYLYAFRESGAIYQPVYLGAREDIEPQECTVSQLKYRCEPATIRV